MDTTLHLVYYRTLRKYSSLKKKAEDTSFYRFAYRKRLQILRKLKRLWKQLQKLEVKLKLGTAAAAIVLMLHSNTAEAQTTLGPFAQDNPGKNPLRPPTNAGAGVSAFSDLDNDGDLDWVIGTTFGTFRYFRNDGTATDPGFIELTGASNPLGLIDVGNGAGPEFADHDGDGDFDLYVGFDGVNYGAGVNVFTNTGTQNNPVFSLTPTVGVAFGFGHSRPALVDIDNDSDLEMFVGTAEVGPGLYYGSKIFYFENDGNTPPAFSRVAAASNPFVLFNDPTINYNGLNPTLLDVDDDGDLDAVAGEDSGNFLYFENTGTINAPAFALRTGAANPFDGIDMFSDGSPTAVDLDGDGDKDIVFGGGINIMRYFRNEGSGVFTEVLGLESPFKGVDVDYDATPAFYDIDGDTDLDAIIGEKYGGGQGLFYFENTGGEFEEIIGPSNPFDLIFPDTPTIDEERFSPAFADIDNDGDYDLFVGYIDEQTYPNVAGVKFYRNNSGVFTLEASPVPTLTGNFRPSPSLGDIDLDGDFDLIMGWNEYGELVYYKNIGTPAIPTFALQTGPGNDPFNGIQIGQSGYSGRFVHPVFVDIDHDGDLDVMVGLSSFFGSENGTVVFLEHHDLDLTDLTPGTFTLEVSSGNPVALINVGGDADPAFADIDVDGDLDVFVGDEYGGISFFENINEAPAINLGLTSVDYTENDPALALDPTLYTTDSDNDMYAIGAVVRFTNNYVPGEDVLEVSTIGNISGTFDAPTGTLILSGFDQVNNYVAVLESVAYVNSSDDPSPSTREVTWYITDWDATSPETDGMPDSKMTINVTPVNDPPVVTTSVSASASFTEGDPPEIIDPGVTTQDVDNTDLQAATISITNNFFTGEDVLGFTDQSGITGSYDPGTGILTLTGVAAVAEYETALQSVTYENTSQDPDPSSRIISFQVDDGIAPSNVATMIMNVSPVNDPPVLSSSQTGTPIYTSGDLIIDNTLDVSDLDNTNLSSASIAITTNFTSGDDMLVFTDQGGITGSYNSSSGILTLSGNATLVTYRDALRTIAYRNKASTPTGATRDFTLIVNDGADDSNLVTVNIDINRPPVISATSTSIIVGGQVSLDLAPFISDPDGNLDITTLSIITQPSSGAPASLTGSILNVDYTGLTFTGNDQLTLEVCDLPGVCVQANVAITVTNNPPVITPPTVNPIQIGSQVVIDLASSLSDPDGNLDLASLIITQQPPSGAVASINGTVLTIDYTGLAFVGSETVQIQVCDLNGLCATADITVLVEGDVIVYNAIAPNGRPDNQYLRIDGLPPGNKVTIYNRWGAEVFSIENYDHNLTGSRFEGQTNDGKNLPAGNYFYKIEINGGPTITGYLSLKR